MKIAIAGGSISGLAAALTLNCVGHEVQIYERSAHALRGQGGGVVVLRRMLRFLEHHGHYCRDMISVPTHRRRLIGVDGSVIQDEPETLPFSSWDAVYRSLCSMLPAQCIHYGREVTGFEQDEEGVGVHFDDGQTVRTDLLIAADGTGSRLRSQLFPDYNSSFAGYIAWRGIVDEAAFDAADIADLVENMTLHRQPGELFMAFLIPALDGSLTPGKRRFNWLWYRNAPDDAELQRHLSDNTGRQHHASVSAGRLAAASVIELTELARRRLPDILSQLVFATKAPFIQAIFDALSPDFVLGRVALVGDAACTLRPHTGSGTSKAADDAVSLAESLPATGHDVARRLADWAEARRVAVAPLVQKGPRLATAFGLGNTTL
jgi:2-polyprenyl-6-methoxyphenol hydroxylase-like FAD-dependent oxidoreductase